MSKQMLSGAKPGQRLLLELGFALGQSHTFGLVAGRCSAAQAYGIRKLREEKLFKEFCERWDDFCPTYLNMSRPEADRIIRHLSEFGPAYFELSQLTRISAETFRAIAPAVSDGVLHYEGEAIPLTTENSRKVAAAVAEMRSALPKKSADSSETGAGFTAADTHSGRALRRDRSRARPDFARRESRRNTGLLARSTWPVARSDTSRCRIKTSLSHTRGSVTC